jgi:3-phytase
MTPKLLSSLVLGALLCSCRPSAPPTSEGATPAADKAPATVSAQGQTEKSASGVLNGAAIALTGGDAPAPRIVTAAGLGGLEVHTLDGKRESVAAAGEATAVAVAQDVPVGGSSQTVIASLDLTSSSVHLFALGADGLTEVGARPFPLGFAAEGACFFRNALDQSLHLFIVGDGGEIEQQIVYANAGGRLDLRVVRRINVPSPLKQCVADARGHVYASEEAVGVWRLNADPESDSEPTLIDTPRLGHLKEESGGLALLDRPGASWLLAANSSAGLINVYDRNDDDAFVGSFAISAAQGEAPIEEPGPMFASGAAAEGFPDGIVLVSDEDAGNVKLVNFADVAQTLSLSAKPAAEATATSTAKPVPVTALVETQPAGSYGDAADDPAIWAHPSDPARSVVIATDKKAGLYVYDMSGAVQQFLPDGKMNNVDLREGFLLGGKPVTLVTASNRTNQSIAIYRFDPATRSLVDVADGVQPTGMADPYGLCMYRSAVDGKTYVFINGDDTLKRQWELIDAGNGKVKTRQVREMKFDSQTEGCVADDEAGLLFVDEEAKGIWMQSAEPTGGAPMSSMAAIKDVPAITADLEGVGIYDLGGGRGYLVVSSQGNDSYAVFRREGKREYLGSFSVVADPVRGIDGISETDGLEVSSRNLGPGFEHGAMVAQDGRNVMPVENQNYKMVPWESIAKALKLEMR